ncbi:hypothetical protein HPB48_011354 [Haemaphysalis longicornis]|uniref:Uncharacterized protein n=1 Tax=Haemaphysalis longicornis TaxID=44386 RepID=A0A9J6GIL2_HAELO|nr:hypothetical protein HPB48_011354 [Haemaphysalis longicornis]
MPQKDFSEEVKVTPLLLSASPKMASKWLETALVVTSLLIICGRAAPPKVCDPGDHEDYDEDKEVATCQGFSQQTDCEMVVEADGCRRCHCPRACPSIYCGLRCRRVLRTGACPYCDCRRGKQVYVLGNKP